MMSEDQAVEDRRHRTRELIDNLIGERRQMWILYQRLAGVQFAEQKSDPGLLKEFVLILIDYIATGHFGLYERIESGGERRKGVLKLADELYPKIAASTSAAVAFNDRYESRPTTEVTDELSRDLSILGENLAQRIELEDRLIEGLLEPKLVS